MRPVHLSAKAVWRALGPGLVTGAADDDPSGIATYSQAGAQFGYALLWSLFLTLPFGVRSQHEDGAGAPGTDPGAPVMARMGRKLIWTTVISAVVFAVAMAAYQSGYLSIERLSKLMGMPF